MDKRKMKKLLILNLPYFLVGLFATNLGEDCRSDSEEGSREETGA